MHLLPVHGHPRREAEAALPDAADRSNYGFNEPPNLPAIAAESNVEKENTKTLIAISLIDCPVVQRLLRKPIERPDILPPMLCHTQDYLSINGLLADVNYLFNRFWYAFKILPPMLYHTNDLLVNLNHCVDKLPMPLLEVFKLIASLIDDGLPYKEAAEDQLMASESAKGPIFGILDGNPNSGENQCVRKCIKHDVLVRGLTLFVASLCHILHEACGIRNSYLFSQYPFESLTALIRRVRVLPQRDVIKQLNMLSEDIIEYFLHSSGLLAELVKLNRPTFEFAKEAEGFSRPQKKRKTGEVDPLKGNNDPRKFLLSLSNLLASPCQGWDYHQVIGGRLEEANKSALVQLFNQYNYPVPSLFGLVGNLSPFSLSSSLKHMPFRLSGAEFAPREPEDRIRKRPLPDGHTDYVSHSSFINEAAFQQEKHRSDKRVPAGWLDCEDSGRKVGFIIPSKVPLDESFDVEVLPEKRYTFKQVIHRLRAQSNKKIGLVIDLTNTDRYYSKIELLKKGIKHVKIACRGRDFIPDNESVNWFVYEVSKFLAKNEPKKYVLVHCTHGHNRTGYMIVHYLMRTEPLITVSQALRRFADARPPGIYNPEYIDALLFFYHERNIDMFIYPPMPDWKDDEDDGDSDLLKGHEEVDSVMKNDILGDGIPSDQQDELRQYCYSALGLTGEMSGCAQFPGSHPVSLNSVNVEYLRQHKYYATWKANGTRYMMLITIGGCYLIDRQFNFRRVQMRFPCKQTNGGLVERTHDFTLLDGEMVIDTVPGLQKQERRYLIYDMMALNSVSLVREPFQDRWKKIWEEIVGPRNHEHQQMQIPEFGNPYEYEFESFKVRRKDFWPLAVVSRFLKKSVPIFSQGLVFQGWDDRYVPRTHEGLLIWTHADMYSVNFLFEVEGGYHKLYLHDHGTKKLFEGEMVKFQDGYDPLSFSGKIIECCWDSNEKCWVFKRIRPDKGTPNDFNTYTKVLRSIKNHITDKILLRIIETIPL